MATFNPVNQFVEDLAHGVHNFSSDQLTVALCAAANAPVATNSVLANLTEISYTNLSSRNLVRSSSGQTSGEYKLILDDLTLTASGAVATWRYAAIYNNTPTSPADPLIGWLDYGSNITMANGETVLLDMSAVNGALQLGPPTP